MLFRGCALFYCYTAQAGIIPNFMVLGSVWSSAPCITIVLQGTASRPQIDLGNYIDPYVFTLKLQGGDWPDMSGIRRREALRGLLLSFRA